MSWARLLRVQLVQVLDDAIRGGHILAVASAGSQRAELHLRTTQPASDPCGVGSGFGSGSVALGSLLSVASIS